MRASLIDEVTSVVFTEMGLQIWKISIWKQHDVPLVPDLTPQKDPPNPKRCNCTFPSFCFRIRKRRSSSKIEEIEKIGETGEIEAASSKYAIS